ncbi:HAD family hydrolase [Mucilaginibacter sp.]
MINTIVFDLGGVLIDWNPEYLYRKLFTDEAAMKDFLTNITTPDWNEEQDAGRSLEEGTTWLVAQHPQHEANIRAFYGRWEEMLGGPIGGTVKLFKQLKDSGRYKIYALTNWSAETFGIALQRYNFLSWFDGIVVSGTEKMRKPDAAFYQLLLSRYQVQPAQALFIDDNLRNVTAAQNAGMQAVQFTGADYLKTELQRLHIL